MKFIAFAAAGLIAATALTPVPAEAQRHGYGYDRGRYDGWNDRRDYRRDRRWRANRGWHGNRNWRGARARTRCTWVRGYYGRQRQCYRVYR